MQDLFKIVNIQNIGQLRYQVLHILFRKAMNSNFTASLFSILRKSPCINIHFDVYLLIVLKRKQKYFFL